MAQGRILVVEGPDDEHTVKAICGAHSLPRLSFKGKQGYDSALSTFLLLVKSEIGKQYSDTVIGLIVDADHDADARWNSIKHYLSEMGYEDVPNELPTFAEGSVIEPSGNLPKVGVWIMPDNQNSGMLEDFLAMCIASDNELMAYARECVYSIAPENRLFSRTKEQKAIMHTWLAWQAEPGRPYGQAITNNSIDARSEQAMNFAAWLSSLYSEDSNEAK